MDHEIVSKIVFEVFEKAKESCASHTKYALSLQIQEETELSYQTAQRAYSKYISRESIRWEIGADSLDILCKYLEYLNYADYFRKNPKPKPISSIVVDEPENLSEQSGINVEESDEEDFPETPEEIYPGEGETKDKPKWSLTLKIVVAFGAVLLMALLGKSIVDNWKINPTTNGCMAWAKNEYVKISCDRQTHPEYDTTVIPEDPKLMANFKKVEVTAAYPFFSEDTGQPRVWYYKNNQNEIEYFTAPGFHPIFKETLKKITKDIIEKYVDVHVYNPDSFLPEDADTSSTTSSGGDIKKKQNMTFLVFNDDVLDVEVTNQLRKSLSTKYRSVSTSAQFETYSEEALAKLKRGVIAGEVQEDFKKIASLVCLGKTNYRFEDNTVQPNWRTCTLTLNLEIIDTNTQEVVESIQKTFFGAGKTDVNAKINTIDKLIL